MLKSQKKHCKLSKHFKFLWKNVLNLSLHDIIQDNVSYVLSLCKWIYSPLQLPMSCHSLGYPICRTKEKKTKGHLSKAPNPNPRLCRGCCWAVPWVPQRDRCRSAPAPLSAPPAPLSAAAAAGSSQRPRGSAPPLCPHPGLPVLVVPRSRTRTAPLLLLWQLSGEANTTGGTWSSSPLLSLTSRFLGLVFMGESSMQCKTRQVPTTEILRKYCPTTRAHRNLTEGQGAVPAAGRHSPTSANSPVSKNKLEGVRAGPRVKHTALGRKHGTKITIVTFTAHHLHRSHLLCWRVSPEADHWGEFSLSLPFLLLLCFNPAPELPFPVPTDAISYGSHWEISSHVNLPQYPLCNNSIDKQIL